MKNLPVLALSTIVMIGMIGSSAQAAPFGSNGHLVKVADATGGTFTLFVGGVSGEVQITLTQAEKTRATTANSCGLAIFKPSTSWNPANIKSVDVASLPTQLLPPCANGALAEPRTANFKTSSGEVVLVGAASANMSLIYNIPSLKKATPKASLAKFNKLFNATGNDFMMNGTNYDLDTIPTVSAPPITRSVNGMDSLYIPSGWIPGNSGS